MSQRSTRGLRRPVIQATDLAPDSIRIRFTTPTLRQRSIISSAKRISSAPATACTMSTARIRAAPAALSAASASAEPGQHGPDDRRQQHCDLLVPPGQRNTRPVHAQQSAAPPTDPIGPAVSIAGVATFGTLSGSPTARAQQPCTKSPTTSRIRPGAHAFRAGADFLYNDDTITFPRSIRGSYSFSSLANFLSGNLQQLRLHSNVSISSWSRRPIPTWLLCAGRVEGELAADAESGPPLRFAVSEDHRHRYQQRLAARGLRLVAVCFAQHRDSRQFRDSSTIACRCARWRTHCSRPATRPIRQPSPDQRQPFTDAGGRAGISEHPRRLTYPPACCSISRTMDRNMQNAYSEQGSLEIEQQMRRKQHVERRIPASCAGCT